MRWVRTYTGDQFYTLGCGRSIVWDPRQCDPFYLAGFNYGPLLLSLTEDTVVIEWDLALSREDRRRFEQHIEAAPDIVHVAPYPHYAFKPDGWDHGWVHRNDVLAGSINEGDPDCQYFGFGLIYFPLTVVKTFLGDLVNPDAADVTDVTFSQWHWARIARRVPVHWDVRPVHLNYDI